MKTFNLLLVVALCAAAGVARADTYNYDLDAPSALASQEEVVVGEGDSVPAPSVESYGVMPSWANGCCERQHSKADHLWDNYCYEKHTPCFKSPCSHCYGKTFCGTGPFQKGCCCKSKCGPKFSLPKLHLKAKCCQKAASCKAKLHSCAQKIHRPHLLGHCTQKAKCCAKKVHCRKPLLSKLKLFRRCHGSKCGKGKAGAVVSGGVYQVDEVPAPAIEGEAIEMPGDIPPVPPMDPAA